MDTVFLILCAGLAAAAVAVSVLLLQRSDLRRDLEWSREEAERWRAEAVKRGWKNPFEECVETLNAGLARLRSAAAAMKLAADAQQDNAAKLRQINGVMAETNTALQRQNSALEAARRHLGRSAGTLSRSGIGPAAPPQPDPLVRAAIERAETELAMGRIEFDPKKLN